MKRELEYHLKKEGVKKLSESPSGRKYLEKVRQAHKLDLLQPKDPMFRRVYGESKT